MTLEIFFNTTFAVSINIGNLNRSLYCFKQFPCVIPVCTRGKIECKHLYYLHYVTRKITYIRKKMQQIDSPTIDDPTKGLVRHFKTKYNTWIKDISILFEWIKENVHFSSIRLNENGKWKPENIMQVMFPITIRLLRYRAVGATVTS